MKIYKLEPKVKTKNTFAVHVSRTMLGGKGALIVNNKVHIPIVTYVTGIEFPTQDILEFELNDKPYEFRYDYRIGKPPSLLVLFCGQIIAQYGGVSALDARPSKKQPEPKQKRKHTETENTAKSYMQWGFMMAGPAAIGFSNGLKDTGAGPANFFIFFLLFFVLFGFIGFVLDTISNKMKEKSEKGKTVLHQLASADTIQSENQSMRVEPQMENLSTFDE